MNELKPCPMCGGTASIVLAAKGGHYVVCNKCLVRTHDFGLKGDCITVWNTRLKSGVYINDTTLAEAFHDFYEAFCMVSTEYSVVQPGFALIKKHLHTIAAVEKWIAHEKSVDTCDE